eukprot:880297-Rhodomonas_salina.1
MLGPRPALTLPHSGSRRPECLWSGDQGQKSPSPIGKLIPLALGAILEASARAAVTRGAAAVAADGSARVGPAQPEEQAQVAEGRLPSRLAILHAEDALGRFAL